MRKIISLLLCLIMVFSITIPTFAATNNSDEVKVVLRNYIDKNGKSVTSKTITFTKDEGKPMNENGRILLPIRKIAEELGYKVDWDGPSDLSPYGVVTISKQLKNNNGEYYEIEFK